MPPQEPQQQAPLGYIIERNLKPEDFREWAIIDEPVTRLRSIVAPPASGKTTFLQQLHKYLGERDHCFVLPWLDLRKDDAEFCDWLDNVAQAAAAGGLHFTWQRHNPRRQFAQEWQEAVTKLLKVCRPGKKPILLADGFDELDPGRREWIEAKILVHFLFPTPQGSNKSNGRAVLARRDEYALTVAVLRWEDETHPLSGLDSEQDRLRQVERRLASVQRRSTEEARELLEWPQATDPEISAPEQAAIAAAVDFAVNLDQTRTSELVGALSPFLTPNPFVNLLFLRRQLLHPDSLIGADDCRDCLERFVARSRLLHMGVEELIGLVGRLDNPESFRLSDNNIPHGNPQFRELTNAGLVAQIPGTARYCFEPAVIQLINQV